MNNAVGPYVVVYEVHVQRLRILLVDDNVDCVETLADLLRELGHQVATAHDGATGLARFETFMPDLAILDLGLPALDGFALAQRVRCRHAFVRVPLIALSGYDSPAHRERATESGFDHHFAKPPNVPKLEALILSYATKPRHVA